ncbi:MAG TPA: carbonic anhydrase [Pyrinomonadaceae bacterium]|nr:carbonic anhydrase [Pyrinomonadaceae bacterium]
MKLQPGAGARGNGRRDFLRTAVLAGCAAALTSVVRPAAALASGQAEALLLCCMDYRLITATGRYMARRGLKNKYDEVVLAGASLGAVTEKYPEWNKTFWDDLSLAIDLHKIHEVLVLDHRDCGAYRLIFGEDFSKDPARETEVHSAQLKRLGELIKERHPELKVELLLMSLDGKVEHV